MTAIEELLEIKKLLSKPECWTTRREARNKLGDAVRVDSPDACSWCLEGAIRLVTGKYFTASYQVLQTVADDDCLNEWNDKQGRTHAEVLKLLDTAIEQERSKS